MKNQIRIDKIKENNNNLIKKVKEEINETSTPFLQSVEKVVEEIKEHASDEKKKENFNKAKELLFSLSNEINNSDNLDKIIELRKKLNSNITKIRKELEKKEFITFEFNRFKDNTIKYRNSIAKNVRFLKREKNINEIERLNSNYDSLSSEELVEFKKLLRREQNYNSKNLVKYKKEEQKRDFFKVSNLEVNKKKTEDLIEVFNQSKLNESINDIKSFYKLKKLPSYDGGVRENTIAFFKSIPNILKNKSILSSINKENELFDDQLLEGFVEYNKRRNSIKLTLKGILNPKYRNNLELLYLRDDMYCSYWIKNCYGVQKILK